MTAANPAGLMLDSHPTALSQVLAKLMDNRPIHAFAGQAGNLRICARAGEGAATSRVELSFEDDGAGIAAEHLDRIFDPFCTTRLGSGCSGLGLHIVHNFVTGVLGGRINVTSKVGGGTRFVLSLAVDASRSD